MSRTFRKHRIALMVTLMLKLECGIWLANAFVFSFMFESRNLLSGVLSDDPPALILLRFKENGPSVGVANVVDVNDDENCSLASRSINFEVDISDVVVAVGLVANGLNGFGSDTFSDSVSDPSSG